MYKFTLTSWLLLMFVAIIDCSDTSNEYHLTQRKDYLKYYFTVENIRSEHGKEDDNIIGFSWTKSNVSNINDLPACYLMNKKFLEESQIPVIIFRMDFVNKQVHINTTESWSNILFYDDQKYLGKTGTISLIKVKSDEKYSHYKYKFQMYIYGEREKVNYGMNLHKCSRTLNESKDDSQEETLSKSQSTTLSATSCCLIILGLSFASVLKSSQ